MGYSLYQMGWILMIYSVLGWCVEVAYAAVHRGCFVNRGFLNGPVCPIYGFGILIVVLLLEPVKDNFALLFFGSVVLTSALEFLVGFIMERFFKDKWWDYSNNPFNIKGYICLEFSIIWGLGCVLVVDVVHPGIMDLINAIPYTLGKLLLPLLFVVLAADGIITLWALLKLPKRFKAMEELEKAIHGLSDAMGENLIYKPVEKNVERLQSFEEKHPEVAEKKQEYTKDILDKRAEINDRLKDREDAGKEALRERKAELEQRLSELRGRGFVQRRITAAYPKLLEGRHNGANFRKLKGHYEGLGARKNRK